MELKMPVKIKEPESTPTSNESRPSQPDGARREEMFGRRFPPEHLLFNVVMTFEDKAPRLSVVETGIVTEDKRIQDAFRRLIEETKERLTSSEGVRAELLRYPPWTWFKFVAPDPIHLRPDKADFWPEGEDVDDFIAAATEGRYEEEDEPDS